jgi:hypothetical protein
MRSGTPDKVYAELDKAFPGSRLTVALATV